MKRLLLSFLLITFMGSTLTSIAQSLKRPEIPTRVGEADAPKGLFSNLPNYPDYGSPETAILHKAMIGDAWDAAGEWTPANNGFLVSSNSEGTSFLQSPALTIPSEGGASVYFKERFELENFHDFGLVWVSEDKGDTWHQLHMVTGASDWHYTKINLARFAGKTVHLLFSFTADATEHGMGWEISDLVLAENAKGLSGKGSQGKKQKQTARQTIKTNSTGSLGATITSLNAQNFPFIFMNVLVDSASTDSLPQSAFMVQENGVLQEDFFQVTPPAAGGDRIADIIFIVDNSGSMGPQQNAIRNATNDFVNSLVAAGVNFRLGLTRYGQNSISGSPIIENNGILTDDTDFYLNEIFSRNEVSGLNEPGLSAINQTISDFSYSPGGQKIFIIVTDEDSDTDFNFPNPSRAEVLSALQQNSITLNAAVDEFFGTTQADFIDLANATNGGVFNVFSPDFSPILNDISQAISGTYLVQYRSSNPVADATIREVVVKVSDNGAEASDTAQYVPGTAPEILLTSNTESLLSLGQVPNVAVTIGANITDAASPFVQSATLFFRTTGSANYQSAAMNNTSGDIWEADIPASAMQEPSVDFYITATDGSATSSLPSVNPAVQPFQISVLPNEPPAISFTPTTLICEGADLVVNATITDNTNFVDAASVFWRPIGQLIFNEVSLNASGSDFTASVPAAAIPSTGIEYYLSATDDVGTSSTFGTVDAPIQLNVANIVGVSAGAQTACVPATNFYTQELTITYANAPAGTDLLVNGQAFAVTGSPQTVLLTDLVSDGQMVDVEIAFSGDINCPKTFADVFEAPQNCEPVFYTLTTTTVGMGSISRSPDAPSYQEGTTVSLTATPDAGWQFDGWSGDATGSANPIEVVMDADKAVTATFVEVVVANNAPQFDVPPTPSGNFVLSAGDTFAETFQASDIDNGDNVSIVSATNVPDGGTFTPALPTPASNPVSADFSWTANLDQWGVQTMTVTAEDSQGAQANYLVDFLVNTPPASDVNQIPIFFAGVPFSYDITVIDPDIAFGDVISIIAIDLPGWINFVDNGDGTATISGTPPASGSFALELEITDSFAGQDNRARVIQDYPVQVNECGITLSANIVPETCPASADGAIDLTINGAAEPVSVQWSNGATTENLIGLTSGQYTATVTDDNGCSAQIVANVALANSSCDDGSPITGCSAQGGILREVWLGQRNTVLDRFDFGQTPSSASTLFSFESPINDGERYISRIRGFICPPQTGAYTFWIASDDEGRLFLSSDDDPANKTEIARVDGWTRPRVWDRYPSQQSISIVLEQGKSYYIEAVQREIAGGDHLAVGWQLPDGTLERPISGVHLSPSVLLLREPENPVNVEAGIAYHYHRGSFRSTDDFSADNKEYTLRTSKIDLAQQVDANRFGFDFVGYYEAPTDGIYAFDLTSDDGSQMYFGSELFIDNDGLQQATSAKAAIGLKAGRHAIRVKYFEAGGSETLRLTVTLPNGTEEEVPASSLFHDPSLVTLRVPENPADVAQGMFFNYHEGAFNSVQDMDGTNLVNTGVTEGLSLDDKVSEDRFGFIFQGFYEAPEDGLYKFTLTSDDGSTFNIGTREVINNDAKQSANSEIGFIALQAGKHAITVKYFDATGSEELDLAVMLPDGSEQQVSSASLFYDPQVYLATLRDPDAITQPAQGIDYKYYEGYWFNLPDFQFLTPVATGTQATFDLSNKLRDFAYAIEFEGYYEAPEDGQYTFATRSDDGSKLFIGDQLVVDNDGLQSATTEDGIIGLKAGTHKIRVAYFERTGSEFLSVSVKAPSDGSLMEIPASALYRENATTSNMRKASTMSTVQAPQGAPEIKLWPNPADQLTHLSVSFGQPMDGGLEISVIDITGKEVLFERWEGASDGTINVSNLKMGVYVVKVKTAEFVMNSRLTVEH